MPVRSCAGCGIKRLKRDLMRIVASDNQLETDVFQRKPGRGAYICYQPACLTQGLRRNRIGLALTRSIQPEEGEELRQEAMRQLRQSILDLLYQAGVAGALSFSAGPGPAENKREVPRRALIAGDLSPARRGRLARLCRKLRISWQLMGNRDMFLSVSQDRSARLLILSGGRRCQEIGDNLLRLDRLSLGEFSL